MDLTSWKQFMFLSLFVIPSSTSEKKDLNILGLFPYSGDWAGGQSMEPAAELGFITVNNDKKILPDYKLKLLSKDTKCDGGKGIDEMYRLLFNESLPFIVILGGGCSTVTQPTAHSSHYWNLIQMSYASSSPLLRERSMFPLLFRMWPEDSSLNAAKFAFVKSQGWRKVATIHENFELFSIPTANFQREAKDHGIEIIATESFTKDPSVQVANLKRNGARIIIGNFYESKARKVFCEAYKLDMYGRAYIWIITGWFSTYWWKDVSDVNCTVEQMERAVEGYFSVDSDPRNRSPQRGPANISTDEFYDMLREYIGSNISHLVGIAKAPYAFDSVWAIAIALHEVNEALKLKDPFMSIANFTYENNLYLDIFEAMSSLNFLGVSGPVKFDRLGGRTGSMMLEQNQNGLEERVAHYSPSMINEPLTWIKPAIWQGDGPPHDSPVVEEFIITIPLVLFITMTTLALCGATLAVGFLIFNISNRNKRFIKMSSPNLNNLILIGGILAYISMIFFGIDSGLVSDSMLIWMCKGHLWSFVSSFSIAYGAMFAKMWRVHRIFTNKKMQKMIIKDNRLYVMIAILLLVDVVIFVVWEFLGPLQVVTKERHAKIDENDVVHVSYVTVCESSSQIYFYGTFASIDVVLLMFGAFLAWETRHVTVKALNDSKYIGMSVYTVVVLSFVGAPVALVIDDVAVHYTLISIFIFFATTLTLCLVFIPKLKDINTIQPNGTFLSQPNGNKIEEDEQTMATLQQYEIQFNPKNKQLNKNVATQPSTST